MPEAMTIASATSDGVPSARLVVLRGLRRGLVFFTDCESDKGAELAANPRAAAMLHWLVPAHRQVRAAGPVERVSEEEGDEFGTRVPAFVSAGRLAAKPRRGQPDGPGNAGPGRAAAPPRRSRFPGRGAGAAFGCCRPALSSGRNRRTACTTGSATAGRRQLDHRAALAVTTDDLSNQKVTAINRPARHLLSQSDKRGARRYAGKRSNRRLRARETSGASIT